MRSASCPPTASSSASCTAPTPAPTRGASRAGGPATSPRGANWSATPGREAEARMASAYQSIEGWFDFDDIYELALRRCSARKPARFVEVGAYKSRSSCYMAERLAETGLDVRFDIVDTFAGDDE